MSDYIPKNPVNRMHKIYGKAVTKYCKQCCNYQKQSRNNETMICIAYSNTVPWDGNTVACDELYNYPFRAIRPRMKQLEEVLGEST